MGAMSGLLTFLDRIVESPPMDEHDSVVIAESDMPSLDVQVPDSEALRLALSAQLGASSDDQEVFAFLDELWGRSGSAHPAASSVVGNLY